MGIIPTDYFQRGWNHQPGKRVCLTVLCGFACWVMIFLLAEKTHNSGNYSCKKFGKGLNGEVWNGKSPMFSQSDWYLGHLGHHCYPSSAKIGSLLASYAKSMWKFGRDATVFDVQGRGSKNNPSGTSHPQIAQRATGPCVRLDFTPLVFSREIPL